MESAGTDAHSTGETAKKRLTRRLEMQEAAREHWQHMADAEQIPDSLDDFGFYYPLEYVQTTCGIAVLSNFAVLPRAGGLNSQDWQWVQDLYTYLHGLARAKYDARPVEHDEDSPRAVTLPRWNPYGG